MTPRHASGSDDDGLIPSRRVRRPLRVSIIALAAGLAVVIGLVAWYFAVYRPAAAEARDRQIQRVVCELADPAVPREKAVRDEYRCPPATRAYPAGKAARPSPKPSATVTPSVPASGAASSRRPARRTAAEPARARTRTPPTRQAASGGRAAPAAPSTRKPAPAAPAPSSTRCLVDLVLVRVC